MAFEIDYELRGEYLFFTARGEVSEDAIVDLGRSIHRCCDEQGVNGVIVDCQAMVGALPPGSLFYATQKFIKQVGLENSVAYINPPKDWKPDEDQFSRSVARNIGGSMELLGTEAAAIKWLQERHT